MSRLTEQRDGRTVTLRLSAPERRNALDVATLRDLVARLRAADEDPEVRAIVLAGTDPSFCAGLDLAEIGSGDLVITELTATDADPWAVLQEITTPTIAAVNGPAVTGGLELVLCCDLAVASEQARFADTHARVGVHPSGGMSVLLPHHIGLRRALEMSLTGRFVAASEAERWGLVNAVVAHDELTATVAAMAEMIAEGQPATISQLLTSYRQLAGLPLSEALSQERRIGRALDPDAAELEQRRSTIVDHGRRAGR